MRKSLYSDYFDVGILFVHQSVLAWFLKSVPLSKCCIRPGSSQSPDYIRLICSVAYCSRLMHHAPCWCSVLRTLTQATYYFHRKDTIRPSTCSLICINVLGIYDICSHSIGKRYHHVGVQKVSSVTKDFICRIEPANTGIKL